MRYTLVEHNDNFTPEDIQDALEEKTKLIVKVADLTAMVSDNSEGYSLAKERLIWVAGSTGWMRLR